MITARIGWRMERSELRWTAALIGTVAAGFVIATVGIRLVMAEHPTCGPDFLEQGCAVVLQQFQPWEQMVQLLNIALWTAPVLGVLLGVAISAGELEQRTAQLSWTLAPSRYRWLALRAIPVGVLLVALLAVGAVAAEYATRSRLITADPGFIDYQIRTVLLPLRGLLAYAMGLLVGVIVGRTLPALLVGIGFSAAVMIGLFALVDIWHRQAATFLSLGALSPETYPMIIVGGNGNVVSGPGGMGVFQIPVADFGTWVVLEATVFAVAITAVAIMAAWMVRRRSPR